MRYHVVEVLSTLTPSSCGFSLYIKIAKQTEASQRMQGAGPPFTPHHREVTRLLEEAQALVRFAPPEECEMLLARVAEFTAQARASKKRLASETTSKEALPCHSNVAEGTTPALSNNDVGAQDAAVATDKESSIQGSVQPPPTTK